MDTMTEPTTQRKRSSPQPVHGSARWVGGNPTQARLDDGDAIIKIAAEGKEPSFFFVQSNREADGRLRGYRLTKITRLEEAAVYDVEITPHGLRCDCPDATYVERPGDAPGCGCKHAKGLKAALMAAKFM